MFRYDNSFFRVIGKLVDCFYASILWLLFCIPIVTIGTATTALYHTVHKVLRSDQSYVWRNFYGAFRANLVQTVKMWLPILLLLVFLVLDKRMFYRVLQTGSPLGALYYFFYFLSFFVLLWAIYIFAYAARFETGVKEALQKGGYMAVMNAESTVLILLILLAGAVMISVSPFWLTLLPAGICYLYDFILERVFCKYMTKEEITRMLELERSEVS